MRYRGRSNRPGQRLDDPERSAGLRCHEVGRLGMTREKQALPVGRALDKQGGKGGSSLGVEVDEAVVHDQRQGFSPRSELRDQCQPDSHVELLLRPSAEFLGRKARTVTPNYDDRLEAARLVLFYALPSPTRDHGECLGPARERSSSACPQ